MGQVVPRSLPRADEVLVLSTGKKLDRASLTTHGSSISQARAKECREHRFEAQKTTSARVSSLPVKEPEERINELRALSPIENGRHGGFKEAVAGQDECKTQSPFTACLPERLHQVRPGWRI
jgi:hypothetical protein